MEFGSFSNDLRTQWTVEYGFAILAEALNHLRRSSPDVAARIPGLGELVGFRNQLIHNYRRVDPEKVWDHAVDDLPELRVAIQSLLNELDRAAEIDRTAAGTGHEENTGGSYEPF